MGVMTEASAVASEHHSTHPRLPAAARLMCLQHRRRQRMLWARHLLQPAIRLVVMPAALVVALEKASAHHSAHPRLQVAMRVTAALEPRLMHPHLPPAIVVRQLVAPKRQHLR